jgi:hypothetical protein
MQAVTHSEAFAEKAEHVIRLEKEVEGSKVSIEKQQTLRWDRIVLSAKRDYFCFLVFIATVFTFSSLALALEKMFKVLTELTVSRFDGT